MNQPAAARANPQSAVQQRIFYLAMDDMYEALVAKAWAKKTDKPIVFFIPLERLTNEMVIVPVVRDAAERTPMLQEEFDPQEQRRKTKRLTGDACVHELHECKPVRVAEFWAGSNGVRNSTDAFSELLLGKLDMVGFINAINESTAQYGVFPRTHHGDDNKVLKLTWGS
jgi:hypothetical protein